MKKLLLIAVSILTVSVMAQPFVKSKAPKTSKEYKAYVKITEPSQQINYNYMITKSTFALKGFNDSKEKIEELFKTFEIAKDKNAIKRAKACVLAKHGFEKEALQLQDSISTRNWLAYHYMKTKKYDDVIRIAPKSNTAMSIYKKNKDFVTYWNISKQQLTTIGDKEIKAKDATKIIQNMFKYRPKTVTKQQQIAFLEQIAQMYPIPGTDFSQWKGFMGFVGFKYKALTGKDLF